MHGGQSWKYRRFNADGIIRIKHRMENATYCRTPNTAHLREPRSARPHTATDEKPSLFLPERKRSPLSMRFWISPILHLGDRDSSSAHLYIKENLRSVALVGISSTVW
jgi:hypothetical protein